MGSPPAFRAAQAVVRDGSRRGFTLVEVLVAGVVLALATSILATAMGQAHWSLAMARDNQRAAELLDLTLTKIDLIGPDRLSIDGPTEGRFPGPEERFAWSAQIRPLTEGHLYEVTVRISWPTPRGLRSVDAQTLLNDPPGARDPNLLWEGLQPRMHQLTRQPAFTLVELVVAMALTALVGGSTLAIFRSASAARQRSLRQMELQQEARAAIGTIANALTNSYRGGPTWVLEGVDDGQGDTPADRIRLLTVSRRAVRPMEPESDVRECEFFLSVGDGEGLMGTPASLLERIDPTQDEEEPAGQGRSAAAQASRGGMLRRLAGGVVGLNILYHDGAEWQTEWPMSMGRWPTAVRVEVMLASDAMGGPLHPVRSPGATGIAPQGPYSVWRLSRVIALPYRPTAFPQLQPQETQQPAQGEGSQGRGQSGSGDGERPGGE